MGNDSKVDVTDHTMEVLIMEVMVIMEDMEEDIMEDIMEDMVIMDTAVDIEGIMEDMEDMVIMEEEGEEEEEVIIEKIQCFHRIVSSVLLLSWRLCLHRDKWLCYVLHLFLSCQIMYKTVENLFEKIKMICKLYN